MATLDYAQRLVLKALINADLALAPYATGPATDYALILTALNGASSPAFWAYKSTITKDETMNGTSVDDTTFDWATAGGYIARSVAERDAWREIWGQSGSVNPGKTNIRAAFDDIFSGTGAGAIANRAHIKAVSRRLATRAEAALATGTGSTAVPGVFGWQGSLSGPDLTAIMTTV